MDDQNLIFNFTFNFTFPAMEGVLKDTCPLVYGISSFLIVSNCYINFVKTLSFNLVITTCLQECLLLILCMRGIHLYLTMQGVTFNQL